MPRPAELFIHYDVRPPQLRMRKPAYIEQRTVAAIPNHFPPQFQLARKFCSIKLVSRCGVQQSVRDGFEVIWGPSDQEGAVCSDGDTGSQLAPPCARFGGP
jgi:hypothetical protein